MSALKFQAVLWKITFPFLSAFHPLTKENYGHIDSSKRYVSPLNTLVSFGLENTSTDQPSSEYLSGNPPC